MCLYIVLMKFWRSFTKFVPCAIKNNHTKQSYSERFPCVKIMIFFQFYQYYTDTSIYKGILSQQRKHKSLRKWIFEFCIYFYSVLESKVLCVTYFGKVIHANLGTLFNALQHVVNFMVYFSSFIVMNMVLHNNISVICQKRKYGRGISYALVPYLLSFYSFITSCELPAQKSQIQRNWSSLLNATISTFRARSEVILQSLVNSYSMWASLKLLLEKNELTINTFSAM